MNADGNGNTDAEMSIPRFPNGLPLFTNKVSRSEKIIFKRGNKILQMMMNYVKSLNKYFSNVVASLNIPNVNNVNIISIQN